MWVKILNSNYADADLEQVATNATQMNSEQRTQLLRLIKDFDYLFDETLGDWETDTVELELNTDL